MLNAFLSDGMVGRAGLMACLYWPLWKLVVLPQESLSWISAPCHYLHCPPQDGETWEEGPCKVCECQQAQVTCYEPSCPPCPVATLALVVKGQCCPDCLPGRSCPIYSHRGDFFPVKKIQIYSWFSSHFFLLAQVLEFVIFLFFFLDKLLLLLIFTEFIWLEPYNFGPPNVLVFFLVIKGALFILKKLLY